MATVGVAGTKRQVSAVGRAFALSQMIGLSAFIPSLMIRSKLLFFVRLPIAMAVLLGRRVYAYHPPSWLVVPSCYAWCVARCRLVDGQFIFLSAYFAKRVAERMSIKSLKKSTFLRGYFLPSELDGPLIC